MGVRDRAGKRGGKCGCEGERGGKGGRGGVRKRGREGEERMGVRDRSEKR